jgi:hypothetical protein
MKRIITSMVIGRWFFHLFILGLINVVLILHKVHVAGAIVIGYGLFVFVSEFYWYLYKEAIENKRDMLEVWRDQP